ncbi:MAG: chemotaxis protein CheB [Clostridiales bacterium]|jgi:two-component system chemotaxis response regulator CheB|nr:chemotaxis protein CheB [Clostridiales bacterium]
MDMSSGRIIIATQDLAFFAEICATLSAESGVGAVINASTLDGVANKIGFGRLNVIIFDVDSPLGISPQSLRSLQAKYSPLIILVGKAITAAQVYTMQGIRDFVFKRKNNARAFVNDIMVKVRERTQPVLAKAKPALGGGALSLNAHIGVNDKVVVIASSTGGTDALEKVFAVLPADCPPTLVVQHMPSGFTKLFADRLNNIYPMTIKEAENGDYALRGQILIAPADQHMSAFLKGGKLAVNCFIGERIHAVMPAADVLFESLVPIMKGSAVGVVLTGMGADGARGLYKMHAVGAKTIVQDAATSVVYGMPKVAYEMGAADYQLPIGEIGKKIMELAAK